jgi:hypothetical protein
MFKKKLVALFIFCAFSSFLSAQNNLPYLGQNPPGMTVKRFPPDSLLGNSQWWWHGSPMFTPDGLEMFWTEYVRYSPSNEQMVLYTMKMENNNWGAVHRPAFGDTVNGDNNPVFSPGGDSLYFFSMRPGGPFFRVTRTATGWSQPVGLQVPVPSGSSFGLEFAINRNNDLYFELSIPASAPADLYVSRYMNGQYQLAVKLGDEVNSSSGDYFPFVDPDDEYLIFASNRPGGYGGQFDMYICFNDGSGNWTQAMNMGQEINQQGAWFGVVSLDKQFLFFNSWKPGDQGYNPYWISAAVIDSLRTLVGIPDRYAATGNDKLFQNEPNPAFGFTTISFELSSPASVLMEVLDESGKLVKTLVKNRYYETGKHSILFDATVLPPGNYFYVLKPASRNPVVRKIVVKQD